MVKVLKSKNSEFLLDISDGTESYSNTTCFI